jgi:hypothetical protein
MCFGMMATRQIVGVRRQHGRRSDNSTSCGIATHVPMHKKRRIN